MYKAAQTELRILKLLGDQDPENKKHCIRLQRSFEYRNHMCMVFEPMVSVGFTRTYTHTHTLSLASTHTRVKILPSPLSVCSVRPLETHTHTLPLSCLDESPGST